MVEHRPARLATFPVRPAALRRVAAVPELLVRPVVALARRVAPQVVLPPDLSARLRLAVHSVAAAVADRAAAAAEQMQSAQSS